MTRKKNSVLWRLSQRDSHYVSYLMGTMHIKDADAFFRIEEAKSCIDASQVVACEFDLNDAQYGNHANDILLPEEMRLSQLIPKSRFSRMSKIFSKSFGLDIMGFDRMLPMVITSILSQKVLSEDHGTSLDQYLWDYGLEKGKKMAGIESYQDQMKVMSQIHLDHQVKQLKDLLRNTQKFRRTILEMMEYYKQEDIHSLYKQSKKTLGAYRNIMLYDRNARMTERIYQLSTDQNCFMAIGAAHLSGEKGVLHLLKKKALIVKPV